MSSWTLKALWISGESVQFLEGSCLDQDRRALTVNSRGKLPCGPCTNVALKVELTDGTTYEGIAEAGIPKVVVSTLPALYTYSFSADPPLVPLF